MFLPGFLLQTEPSTCFPGAINFKKGDLTIISSLTQYYYHQNSCVILYIWECGNVSRRGEKVNKERWYCRFLVNDYNIWNSTKALMNLTILGGHSISWCRGEIILK